MSELRRIARLNKVYGSQVLATVEETHLGYTTVRLIATGARMTNLYTVGRVEVGTRVIVEYSTDGTPYVRPMTIPNPQLDVLPDASSAEDEDTIPKNSLVVCKLSRTGTMTLNGSTLTTIPMNRKIFDPLNLGNGTGIMIVESGVYLVHATIRIDNVNTATSAARPAASLYVYFHGGDNVWHILSGVTHRAFGTGSTPINVIGMQILYQGEEIRMLARVQSALTSPSVLIGTGYPILECWRVSEITEVIRVIPN